MSTFLQAVWAMFTNNGMYSNVETVGILIFSVIFAIGMMALVSHKASEDEKANMIYELGYEGYLRHMDLRAQRQRSIHID